MVFFQNVLYGSKSFFFIKKTICYAATVTSEKMKKIAALRFVILWMLDALTAFPFIGQIIQDIFSCLE